jgi:hypothetical protein
LSLLLDKKEKLDLRARALDFEISIQQQELANIRNCQAQLLDMLNKPSKPRDRTKCEPRAGGSKSSPDSWNS